MAKATIYKDIRTMNGKILFEAEKSYEVVYSDEFYIKIENQHGFKVLVNRDFDMDVDEGEE